jgi:hypothetical protein
VRTTYNKTLPKRPLQHNLNESWNTSCKMNPCFVSGQEWIFLVHVLWCQSYWNKDRYLTHFILCFPKEFKFGNTWSGLRGANKTQILRFNVLHRFSLVTHIQNHRWAHFLYEICRNFLSLTSVEYLWWFPSTEFHQPATPFPSLWPHQTTVSAKLDKMKHKTWGFMQESNSLS